MTASPATGSGPSAEVAAAGLQPLNLRPPLGQYISDLWRRRHFLRVFASAQLESTASSNRLGRYWYILSPILSAATYWFVFGVLLGASRGVQNYIAFLIIGMFLYSYSSASMTTGANSISGSATLIQSLHFPRASVPLSSTLLLFFRLRFELAVMLVIVLITGEPITWTWLLLPVVVILMTMFNVGMALAMARIVVEVPDIRQLLPFITRTWMFLSGVMFSIAEYARNAPGWVQFLLEINPLAVFLDLARDVLMESSQAPPGSWWLGLAWAVGMLVAGFVYFWRAEEKYGRV